MVNQGDTVRHQALDRVLEKKKKGVPYQSPGHRNKTSSHVINLMIPTTS